ncbi:MAG: hypothetical protein CVV41_18340 [Candidatus Riflebacteria bacterium HGW-Riflebacteria-1]|jgi:ABC-2 type transport system permease protein|nr:MAG: hypothetical protein CVV41_18340 [Candidatus Riflebacteria bacterium HGW-Riflebacteria-1]
MNSRAILAILRKDLLDGMRNYQVVLMVLTPIILSLLFTNVMSGSKTSAALPEIGVISSPQQPLIESLIGKGLSKKITFYQNRHDLESAILEGRVRFGIIMPDIISPKSLKNEPVTLLYPPHIPDFGVETLKSAFETEIRAQLNMTPQPLPFEFKVEAVSGSSSNANAMADSMFPMLMVMAMGMVGFLALPMAIVEEREKGTLNAIFLTQIKTSEFITGKSLFSLFLAVTTITVMLSLNQKWGDNVGYLILIIFSGALMTIFTGLIIANFAKTQAAVNAIGTTLFLFFQMIPSLQHSSDIVRSAAPFVPSTYIFSALRKAMFLDLAKVTINDDIMIIVMLTAVAYLIAHGVYRFKQADK